MIFKNKKILSVLIILLAFSATAKAYESLLYYELQAIGGYNLSDGKTALYSFDKNDVMQKPSAGFDYIGRISGNSSDKAAIFLQGRFAYDEDGKNIQGQLYNAYINLKAAGANLWAGHNKPAFGLSSVLDNHALLMPSLVSYGFGFDRDWGAGFLKDTQWGAVSFSITSGSGMPLYTDGNYFVSSRISKGVLNRDNSEFGLSLAKGEILDIMGYHVMSAEKIPFTALSADYSLVFDRYSLRSEYLRGFKNNENIQAFFIRFGINVFNEQRGLIEFQPAYINNAMTEGFYKAVGFSYVLSSVHTVRAMYHSNPVTHDETIVFQWYIYGKL